MCRKSFNLIIAFGIVLVSVGCAYFEPGTPDVDPDPGPKGPGVFSGRSGSWVIINK